MTDKHDIWRVAILAGLLLGTLLIANQLKDVAVAPLESADVSTNLPVEVSDWQGQGIWYCQSESCARAFLEEELRGNLTCPVCGGKLSEVSVGERTLLPPDTVVVRKSYRDRAGDEIVVTIVISGNDQRSIHRPEQCLPAQGFEVKASRVVSVPISGRVPLAMTVMSSENKRNRMVMAYWFMGGGHETPSHFQRLGWMAWDNVLKGVRPRWAYVSLQMPERGMEGSAIVKLSVFASRIYPLIRRTQGR